MSRIPLLGGAYRDRSNIASAQETINLYPEKNTNVQAPAPVTHYLTPGSVLFGTPAVEDGARGSFRTSLGTAYCVVGVNVYFVTANGAMVQVGVIADRASQVIFADNGLVVVLVDGVQGWAINMEDNVFGEIIDPSFYGADYVVFLDTFFVFNRPDTNQFYISLSNATFSMLLNSGIETVSITNGGTLYTPGTYTNVLLVGGSSGAYGATANITVNGGGVVSAVEIVDNGQFYQNGDNLTANAADIGGTGSGFNIIVTSLQVGFDPLDIAAKSGSADPIVGIATVHKELWLIGTLTTEIWIGTGAADFYFQLVQGAYIDHGCLAQFSIATQDVVVMFIGQDKQGQYQIFKGAGYEISIISTSYLTDLMSKMVDPTDVVAGMFQQENHAFYVLSFVTDNITFVYDLFTDEWFRWAWLDENGNINRHRAQNFFFFDRKNLIVDWETGKLYYLDPQIQTDFDGPILRRKTFIHMVGNKFERVNYISFTADIEAATSNIDDPEDPPKISLFWSDDRGKTYSFPVEQSMGLQGQYQTTISWNRLGQARDRVFKLEWSEPFPTSLLGGFAEVRPARS